VLHLRIERQANFPVGQLQKGAGESRSASAFSSMMNRSQSKLQLESLMPHLEKQGQTLVQSRTIEHLRDYKKAVKEFVREAVNAGLQLSDKQSYHHSGSMKTHQIVEKVDQKLLELHDEVMGKEERGLEVLRLVGEIKGLLINLYM
jgi:uncharacterized protein